MYVCVCAVLLLCCCVLWGVCVGVRCVMVFVVCVCGGTLPEVSLRRAGIEQLHQEKRMIGGIWNVLFSTCSQTLNG